MTSVARILLDDACAALSREVDKARGRMDVSEAAVIWLGAADRAGAELKPLAAEAAACRGAARTYRQVAVLGFAVSASPAPFEHQQALEAGLTWLFGLPLTSAGSSVGFVADPVAMLGIALGCRHAPAPLVAVGRQWMSQFVDHSSGALNLEAFERVLWAAVQSLVGFPPTLPLPPVAAVADARVAMRGKGIFPAACAADTQEDERQVLTAMQADDQSLLDPVRAAIRLAAYTWIRRTAPVVVPSRMTPGDVIDLLRGLDFGLKRWTWEDKPRTTTGTARQWHIDNEYHVQNLLWFVLAPIFPDLTDEEYTVQLGPKNPRSDIGIPSLKLIVEAKFLRAADAPKKMVEQIAQDASLYLVAGSRYTQIIAFVWDDLARTNQHGEMVRAMQQIDGVLAAVVVSRPGDWK